jgi:FKBP-type peptidyl-prolyl cis-trans isomerase FkpA
MLSSSRVKRTLILAGFCLVGLACASAAEPPPPLETEDDKTLYALGLALSARLKNYDLNEKEVALVKQGLHDGILGDPKVEIATYGPKLDPFLQTRFTAAAAKEKTAGAEFVQKMAAEPGAEKLESGMVYIEQQAGTGASPSPSATVKVHYDGTLRDGDTFDSSRQRGEPATFSLNGVIPCFAQGIGKMKVGGKAKLICPAELAYGDRGSPPNIGAGATLVVDVELLEVTEGAPAAVEPPAP